MFVSVLRFSSFFLHPLTLPSLFPSSFLLFIRCGPGGRPQAARLRRMELRHTAVRLPHARHRHVILERDGALFYYVYYTCLLILLEQRLSHFVLRFHNSSLLLSACFPSPFRLLSSSLSPLSSSLFIPLPLSFFPHTYPTYPTTPIGGLRYGPPPMEPSGVGRPSLS